MVTSANGTMDRNGEDRVVVRLPTNIGRENAVELEGMFEARFRDGEKRFVVDAADVQYMTSGGIGFLVSILTRIRDQGGDLYVRNLNARMKGLFELTNLDKLFEIR